MREDTAGIGNGSRVLGSSEIGVFRLFKVKSSIWWRTRFKRGITTWSIKEACATRVDRTETPAKVDRTTVG